MVSSPPTPPAEHPDAEAARAARLLAEGLSPSTPAPASMHTPSAEEIAALFPKLEILDVLGQGGMGVVYKARQPRLDRLVALKILYRELAADPAFPERFEREAKALARLDHPHIVRVHDFGVTDGIYWLLLEYVDGASLRELMASGQMTSKEALGIVPQICDALQYAHDAGVVHRDIKPENVLIDTAANVKIADFGLAKLVGANAPEGTLTGTQQVMGTWQYMAPEQYRAPRDVDHRADIFSLGVVFYEMLTGDLPVGRYRQPSETQALDGRIDAIVMRTMEREREQRYQQAADVRKDVEAVGTDPEMATAEGTRSSERNARPPRHTEPNASLRPTSRWLLAAATLTLPLGMVVLNRLRDIASDGPYAEVAAWWTRAQVFSTLIWGLGIVLVIAAHRHATSTASRVAPTLVLLVQLTLIGLVWIGGRQSNWSAFITSRSIDYETRNETWVSEVRDRFAPGDPLPVVEVEGGRALRETSMRAALEGVLEIWQEITRGNNASALSPLEARGLYSTEDANVILQFGHLQFQREQQAMTLGFPFVTEAQLGLSQRELYVSHIRLDPEFKSAEIQAVPRREGLAFIIRFPMVRGESASDWRFGRGRVLILNKSTGGTPRPDLRRFLLEGGRIPEVEGGQLESSRQDALAGVLELWQRWATMVRDRDLSYEDLRLNDRTEQVYTPSDATDLWSQEESVVAKAQAAMEVGMGFVTLEQRGIAAHRLQVVHIQLGEHERTARVEVRPIPHTGEQRPRVSITTIWPGAGPEEIEREIVQKQEAQLQAIEGVTELSSESKDSHGSLTLEFHVGTDMNAALRSVNTRLQQMPPYPEGARKPVLSHVEARPITGNEEQKPGFYFQARRDEGRWWFAVAPVEIDR